MRRKIMKPRPKKGKAVVYQGVKPGYTVAVQSRLKTGRIRERFVKAGFRSDASAKKFARSKGYKKVKSLD